MLTKLMTKSRTGKSLRKERHQVDDEDVADVVVEDVDAVEIARQTHQHPQLLLRIPKSIRMKRTTRKSVSAMKRSALTRLNRHEGRIENEAVNRSPDDHREVIENPGVAEVDAMNENLPDENLQLAERPWKPSDSATGIVRGQLTENAHVKVATVEGSHVLRRNVHSGHSALQRENDHRLVIVRPNRNERVRNRFRSNLDQPEEKNDDRLAYRRNRQLPQRRGPPTMMKFRRGKKQSVILPSSILLKTSIADPVDVVAVLAGAVAVVEVAETEDLILVAPKDDLRIDPKDPEILDLVIIVAEKAVAVHHAAETKTSEITPESAVYRTRSENLVSSITG